MYSDRRREFDGRRSRLLRRCCIALLLLAWAGPSAARVLLTVEEALGLAFPGCEVQRRTLYLTDEQMRNFRTSGRLDIEGDQRERFIDNSFRAAAFDDDATMGEIRRMSERCGMVLDPHTATGTAAARLLARTGARSGPMITLGTAHPAKFPDAVEQATGVRPALPAHLADLFDRPERTRTVANDLAEVQHLVESLTR